LKQDIKYRCYDFSLAIITYTGEMEVKKQHLRLLDQLFRSGTSVGANIIEGKSASSRKELIRYYEIALRSANESKYWLCLVRDGIKPKGKENETKQLLQEADELSKIIAASIITLKGKRNKDDQDS
jgi:four helix bundle protein